MREIFVDLAGCNVKIQLSQDIRISERLQPFIRKGTSSNVDVVMEICACEQLPKWEDGGYWEGLNYYVYREEELYVFHGIKRGTDPFSVTCFRKDGNVSLFYLKEYESYFVGSSGIFNRIGAEQLFLQRNRLMLHASFIKYKDQGILFSAPSGTGKSTQAELWKRAKGAEVINGDRVAVGFREMGWTAWGIPYAGTSGIYRNESAAIQAIIVLRQAPENRIRRLNAVDALRYLYPEVTIHQWDGRFVEKATDLLSQLISDVPVFLLECLPEESAVEALYGELFVK